MNNNNAMICTYQLIATLIRKFILKFLNLMINISWEVQGRRKTN